MSGFLVRLVVLALVSALLCLLIWAGRHFVEMRRRQALAAEPLELQNTGDEDNLVQQTGASGSSEPLLRILAFSSADCHQCHQLQAPVLQHVQQKLGDAVTIVEDDAPNSP